jgi:hypothetical protein
VNDDLHTRHSALDHAAIGDISSNRLNSAEFRMIKAANIQRSQLMAARQEVST